MQKRVGVSRKSRIASLGSSRATHRAIMIKESSFAILQTATFKSDYRLILSSCCSEMAVLRQKLSSYHAFHRTASTNALKGLGPVLYTAVTDCRSNRRQKPM